MGRFSDETARRILKKVDMKCKSKLSFFLFTLLLAAGAADAALTVKMDKPQQVGKKAVIKLTMKNTFTEKIESARAQVFLLDENGRMVGQASRWVIGGTKDKPALAPDTETNFNFVVSSDKPFITNKVTFTRLILEGGKVVDVNQNVQMQQ
jgi:hypothetical protein